MPEACPPLNSYYVYLTGGCNLACRHCWIAPSFQPDGGTGGHLDYELLELAIDEGLPLGLNHVKLTGGEPLLHPDLVRIVDLLRDKGQSFSMETNGTLLTGSLARYLKEKSTLSVISVSLDGAEPDTHDAFRGVKGSFNKACQGIRYLVEVGYRPQVIMSLHRGNVHQIEEMVRLAVRLGAGSVKFNMVQPSGRGELMTKRGNVLDVHRLIELGRWIEGDLQGRFSIPLRHSLPMAFYSLSHLQAFDGYSCSIFNILGILHSGEIAMCGIGTQVHELCYGILGSDRVADMWTSNPTLIDLRRQLPAHFESICGECIFRDRCLGTCVAENYKLAGRMTAPHWFCRIAAEEGHFPPTRRKSSLSYQTVVMGP